MWQRYTTPTERLPVAHQRYLEDEDSIVHHETFQPLARENCMKIVSENRLRLGKRFCLWCGLGPMSTTRCLCLQQQQQQQQYEDRIRGQQREITGIFTIHTHPCQLHNHVHPRGMCPGRCEDCGGCNQDVCTHYNPSGGPIHPNPSNEFSIPNCSRVSEDGTRCYRRLGGDSTFDDTAKGERDEHSQNSSNSASLLNITLEHQEPMAEEQHDEPEQQQKSKKEAKKSKKAKKIKSKKQGQKKSKRKEGIRVPKKSKKE